jgi:diguanylate cyclase (GGDEF)-like protein/PAS domain S-box-containing protein
MTLDAEGRIENWNASIGRVTGYAESSIIGEPFSVFYPEGAITPERVADYLREADDNGWSLDDGWRTKADGSRFWGSSMIAPLDDAFLEQISSPIVRSGSERGYALIMRDITDKHVATEKQLSAMLSDHLTGIPNRRAFFEAADLEMKRWRRFPRPLSVLVIDADHFKKINDTFGHATGDVVLRDLGQTLKKSVREIDIIARVGGEEFAALLPSTDLEGAKILAERIRKEIEWKSLTVDGITIQYTVSIGISTMTDAVTGFDELLKLADQALYQAKGAGRNQIKMASGGAAH